MYGSEGVKASPWDDINFRQSIFVINLCVYNSKILALTPTWSLACKQTDYITAGMLKLLDPSLY